MKLYLMRHGEAAFKGDDPKQGLTSQGKLAIERLAKKLADRRVHQTTKQEMNIEQVFHSEKTRAQQTAEIMTNIIAPEVTPLCRENLKPNDHPEKLLTELETWTRDTLITSHLPFIPGLLALLTKDQPVVSFDPGTIVCLIKEGANWRLDWVDRPEEYPYVWE